MLLLLCALLAFCRATGGQLCVFSSIWRGAEGAAGRVASPPLRTIDAAGLGRQCPNVVPIFGSRSNFIDRRARKRRASTDNRKRRNNRRRWAAPFQNKTPMVAANCPDPSRHQRPRNSWRPQLIKCKSASGRIPAPELAAQPAPISRSDLFD